MNIIKKIAQIIFYIICLLAAILAVQPEQWEKNIRNYVDLFSISGKDLSIILLFGLLGILSIKLVLQHHQIRVLRIDRFPTPNLFNALQKLASNNINQADLHGIDFWIYEAEKTRSWLKDKIKHANEDLHIISYSFISYKDFLEKEIRSFLKNGGKLHILLLKPESKGFYEKTVLESYDDSRSIDYDSWPTAIKQLQTAHISDFKTSIDLLKKWQSEFSGAQINIRLYQETPNISGILIDNKSLCVSSHFINPISRGFNNPFLCIEDVNTNQNFLVIKMIFKNWFCVKFTNGDKV